MFLLQEARTI